MFKYLLLALLVFVTLQLGAQQPLYKNPSLSTNQRVDDLLSRMTLEEKSWQLFMIPGDIDQADSNQYKNGIFGFQVSAAPQGDAAGQLLTYKTKENALTLAQKINRIQKYFIEHTRLGIPIIAFDEALHGLVRQGTTSFPQSIGLAASFDTLLMNKVANAIADETKSRGIRDVLSPVINIASDVRWGRVEETYGEDPFLTSAMAVAYIGAFERKNIITTPKHLIANVGDGGRDSYPIHFNDRFLEEIHFPPFIAAIKKAGMRSVMTSYNSVDGIASSSNSWLLQQKLKKDWGFTGFVISDASAVGGEMVLHYTAKDYASSGAHAINNGLDVIFQTQYKHHDLFYPAFSSGLINITAIDEAVRRVLRAKFELGLFEHPYVDEAAAAQWISTTRHKLLALQAAREAIVLLKNERHRGTKEKVLPLTRTNKTIAVFGEEATAGRLGGYSGPGNGVISILDAIREKKTLPTSILYSRGAGVLSPEWLTISEDNLFHVANGRMLPGLEAAYYSNLSLQGDAKIKRIDKNIDFVWTLSSPDKNIAIDNYSVRWTGRLKAPASGPLRVGLDGNDGYRLYIDNEIVIDHWTKNSFSTKLYSFLASKNQLYDVRIEFFEPVGNAHLKLVWDFGAEKNAAKQIRDAVAVAKKADVAVIVAGIHEGEFQDRAYLSLPGHQEELINAIAATGQPVIVVLTGGSAVVMNNWLSNVSAVIHAWYPGEEGGRAVADVLFGDYNPAGRLPITFPVHESQLPLVYNHKPTGRGDDYYNLSGLPLFPFGYGLSYTTFSYDSIWLDKSTIGANDTALVTVSVTNTGKLAGDEVVQLYIHDVLASVARPVLELKGFQRGHFSPGETKQVKFAITPELLHMLDKDMHWIVEPGEFRIMVGASSRELWLKTMLKVD